MFSSSKFHQYYWRPLALVYKITIIIRFNFTLDSDCTFKDFDFFGGDLSMTKSRNAESCKKKCDTSHECKKWTFFIHPSSRKCFLKRTNGTISKTNKGDSTGYRLTGFKNSHIKKICGLNGEYWFFIRKVELINLTF